MQRLLQHATAQLSCLPACNSTPPCCLQAEERRSSAKDKAQQGLLGALYAPVAPTSPVDRHAPSDASAALTALLELAYRLDDVVMLSRAAKVCQ